MCLYLDAAIDLHEVNSRAPFGIKIGAGDSLLHNCFEVFKSFENACHFRDAHGFMRSVHNIGRGYV